MNDVCVRPSNLRQGEEDDVVSMATPPDSLRDGLIVDRWCRNRWLEVSELCLASCPVMCEAAYMRVLLLTFFNGCVA
jgi:uncharacterized protein (DUF2237 family)